MNNALLEAMPFICTAAGFVAGWVSHQNRWDVFYLFGKSEDRIPVRISVDLDEMDDGRRQRRRRTTDVPLYKRH